MSTPNPHHGQNTAVLLNPTYVFAAFLILALSGNLALVRGARGRTGQDCVLARMANMNFDNAFSLYIQQHHHILIKSIDFYTTVSSSTR